MSNSSKFAFIAIIVCTATLFSGCTYQAAAVSSASPTGEIRTDRVRDVHVGVVNNISDNALTMNARKVGYACSAHTYPIDVGPALRETIGKVIDASFSSYETLGSATDARDAGVRYTMVFDLDEFDSSVSYSAGFWSGSATATTSITLRVRVLDSNGEEVLRTNINGDGNGTSSGGCGESATALGEAASEAVSEVLENFVYKVINSDQMDRAY